MEAQLQSRSVLHRLNILEKRLDELETQIDTEKVEKYSQQLLTSTGFYNCICTEIYSHL